LLAPFFGGAMLGEPFAFYQQQFPLWRDGGEIRDHDRASGGALGLRKQIDRGVSKAAQDFPRQEIEHRVLDGLVAVQQPLVE